MFDFFKFKKNTGDNVVKFPAPHVVPPVPGPEKPATVYYRIGVTDKNRVAFNMGYSEITMNKAGVQNLINQLETFKNQLTDEAEDE